MEVAGFIVAAIGTLAGIWQLAIIIIDRRKARKAADAALSPNDPAPTSPGGGALRARNRVRIQADGHVVMFRVYDGDKNKATAIIAALVRGALTVADVFALIAPRLLLRAATALALTSPFAAVPVNAHPITSKVVGACQSGHAAPVTMGGVAHRHVGGRGHGHGAKTVVTTPIS